MRRHSSLLHVVLEGGSANRSVLEAAIAPWGFETRVVATVAEALDALDANRPDAVLVAVEHGDAEVERALDAVEKLRARDAADGLPIVLLARDASGESALDARLRARAVGATDVLDGASDAGILVMRLQRLVETALARRELERARDALAARNRELEGLRREQHELMEFLAHDLKNPMMVVAGNLEWIRAGEGMTSRLVEAVDDASHAAARIRSMVENFLMVSRLEHSEFPLCPECVEVDTLLSEVAASVAERARTQQVEVSFHVDPGLSVNADSVLLHRVLKNMVDTALRNTPASGRIALEAHRGDGVEIAISNSGPPMPEAVRAHLFDKLARPRDPSAMLEDTGLGFYFCKCAVEAHSGHIGVFETGDWPTSFVIQLPFA